MKTLEFDASHRDSLLNIGDDSYRLSKEVVGKDGHIKKIIFSEFDKVDYDENIAEIVDYIIHSVKSKLSAENILKDVLLNQSLETIDKLHKLVERRAKVSMKKGCLSVKIGNAEIPIVD